MNVFGRTELLGPTYQVWLRMYPAAPLCSPLANRHLHSELYSSSSSTIPLRLQTRPVPSWSYNLTQTITPPCKIPTQAYDRAQWSFSFPSFSAQTTTFLNDCLSVLRQEQEGAGEQGGDGALQKGAPKISKPNLRRSAGEQSSRGRAPASLGWQPTGCPLRNSFISKASPLSLGAKRLGSFWLF